MSAHTPGPWFVERMYEASRTIAMMRDFKGPNVALAVHGPQNWIHASGAAEQIEANARLIAAAPELLKLTRGAWHLCESILAVRDGIPDESIRAMADALLAAIAKAEGR